MLFLPLALALRAGPPGLCALLPVVSVAHAEGGANAPVAEAGLGVFAYVGDTVILNGTASSDPDGQTLTYAWTQTSGPPVALADATTDSPSFVVTEPGTIRVQLIVSDGGLTSAPDSVAVIVPDREAQPLGAGGCATAGAPSWLAVAGVAAALSRRRSVAAPR